MDGLVFDNKKEYLKQNKYFNANSRKLVKISEGYMNEDNMKSYTLEELEEILNICENYSLVVRSVLQERDYSDEEIKKIYKDFKNSKYNHFDTTVRFKTFTQGHPCPKKDYIKVMEAFQKLPVHIEEIQDGLHIFVPYTFRRSYKYSYLMAEYVWKSLKKWQLENHKIELKFPCSIILERRVKDFKYMVYCDNDNYEMRNIINSVLSNEFKMSDNPIVMDCTSTLTLSDKIEQNGVHIYIVPRLKYGNILKDFYFKNEEKA